MDLQSIVARMILACIAIPFILIAMALVTGFIFSIADAIMNPKPSYSRNSIRYRRRIR
jgi:hypothetical protein